MHVNQVRSVSMVENYGCYQEHELPLNSPQEKLSPKLVPLQNMDAVLYTKKAVATGIFVIIFSSSYCLMSITIMKTVYVSDL